MLLLVAAAYAGKLADGFRGLPFGPSDVLESPPQPQGCVMGEARTVLEKGVRWSCVAEINGVAARVSYIIESGWYYGVQITPPEDFAAARAVHEALTAAYGPCAKNEQYATGPLPDCRWNDSDTTAAWTYNQFNDQSAVSIFNKSVFAKVDAARKTKAAAAASGL